jgi:hypothetical protein
MQQRDKRQSDKNEPLMNERTGDLQDSPRDQERLQPEETTIDLPEVKDIPGQEHIHPPMMGEMADTTASSADEEGEGLFDDDEEAGSFKLNNNASQNEDNSTLGNP